MAVVMGMSHGTTPDIHPFFVTKTISTAGSDFDQNESRRKRQRTASPTRPSETKGEPVGVEQLRMAAFSDLSSADIRKVPNSVEDQDIKQLQASRGLGAMLDDRGGRKRAGADVGVQVAIESATIPSAQSRPVDGNSALESSATTSTKRSQRAEISSDPISTKTSERTRDVTPPKKMLRVRPDGKLGSPKGRGAQEDAKPKRSRRSTKLTTASKSFLITFKYGTDHESRLAIGKTISETLAGKVFNQSLVKTEDIIDAGTPKATHPFFLGGTARAIGARSAVPNADVKKSDTDVSSPPVKRQDLVPKRSRVTSKPPDLELNLIGGPVIQWQTFGSDHARVFRFPGAVEPAWPPRDMMHRGRGEPPNSDMDESRTTFSRNVCRKLKGVEVKISEDEEVLKPYIDSVQDHHSNDNLSQRPSSRGSHQFHRPIRQLMSGASLQKAVGRRLRSKLERKVDEQAQDDFEDVGLGTTDSPRSLAHKALQHAYAAIPTSVTAFDRFECETQEWVHKYAPKTAEEVLQPGPEAILLRDWLMTLTTHAVERCTHQYREPSLSRRSGRKTKRRKRKKATELGEFVISSDEELSQMDEMLDTDDDPAAIVGAKRSVIRRHEGVKSSSARDGASNAVVVSGPHGCGKTAAVYAVARELGFEIFEINAGSRRSGKDIMDRVGDMTRNHLVGNTPKDHGETFKVESQGVDFNSDNVKKDIEAGRQGTMNKFFETKSLGQKLQLEKHVDILNSSPKKQHPQQKPRGQKQSLILLEEVDVLFEEDKMFWTTTLSLIVQSRRPVIMSCTDERLLPLDDLMLYGVLRFAPPAAALATDYLMLVASNEGHLLSFESVETLYKAKGSDLRASISELNFFCQMAVGDTKGGLDWMLIEQSSQGRRNHNSHSPRVVSEGTYQSSMGSVSANVYSSSAGAFMDQDKDQIHETGDAWRADHAAHENEPLTLASTTAKEGPRVSKLKSLHDLDLATDALSAADTFPTCMANEPGGVLLETNSPELTDSMRSNFTEGSEVLLADPVIDHTGVTEAVVFTLKASASILRYLQEHDNGAVLFEDLPFSTRVEILQRCHHGGSSTHSHFHSPPVPLVTSTNAVFGIPTGPQISSFDGPPSKLFVDIAPYIRNIVSYDLRLEEQRRQLSSLISRPGKDGKAARTTRSSRAALEGGQKAYTRRERWFPNDTNLDLVLQTGGAHWQSTLSRFMTENFGELREPDYNDSKE